MSSAVSVLELFSIGLGPSSSHTVGPMRAARTFAQELQAANVLPRVSRVVVRLYASLALTGRGHGTDRAVLLGLEGEEPETVDVDSVPSRVARIRERGKLCLAGTRDITFDVSNDLEFLRQESLPLHPNGLRFLACAADGSAVLTKTFYSVGGGFVVDEESFGRPNGTRVERPFPYETGNDLLRLASESRLSISEMTLRNEATWRAESETRAGLLRAWQVMQECVARGCACGGVLPGGLQVDRRAPRLHASLREKAAAAKPDPLVAMDWLSLWAMAVNEENAVGGRVVTAPTNGAAGIIPAVLHYLVEFHGDVSEDRIVRFLLTAGAIAILFKLNASLSGAEVGCQGEVGVACSMAAGALCESLGGTASQVENAAEIGMEHNLGLTCDPIGGLVQVPCIERNAMGAVKAVNAARLALSGDGVHRVSLDKVIRTMRQTGADMSTKYKETSRGGLAVNVPEC